jgi:hypothetical protein
VNDLICQKKLIMGSFDQNSFYIPPFFAVFAQKLGQFPQNVGFCPDFLYIAHLGIPEIWAIARKDEFAQKSIFRCNGQTPKDYFLAINLCCPRTRTVNSNIFP